MSTDQCSGLLPKYFPLSREGWVRSTDELALDIHERLIAMGRIGPAKADATGFSYVSKEQGVSLKAGAAVYAKEDGQKPDAAVTLQAEGDSVVFAAPYSVRGQAGFTITTKQKEEVVTESDLLGMALAFHHALSDSAIGDDDLKDIRTGLKAAIPGLIHEIERLREEKVQMEKDQLRQLELLEEGIFQKQQSLEARYHRLKQEKTVLSKDLDDAAGVVRRLQTRQRPFSTVLSCPLCGVDYNLQQSRQYHGLDCPIGKVIRLADARENASLPGDTP